MNYEKADDYSWLYECDKWELFQFNKIQFYVFLLSNYDKRVTGEIEAYFPKVID